MADTIIKRLLSFSVPTLKPKKKTKKQKETLGESYISELLCSQWILYGKSKMSSFLYLSKTGRKSGVLKSTQ